MSLNRRDSEYESRSLIDTLMTPFKSIKDLITGDDEPIRSDDRNPIVGFITLPFRLMWGFAVFMVQAWTSSRNGIAFLRGLPALSIMAITPFLVWFFNNYERQITIGPSLGYHQMHVRNKVHDRALVFSKKLVELRPDSVEFKYSLAEDIARNGDRGEATRLMQFLAGDTDVEPVAVGEDNVTSDDGTNDGGTSDDGTEDPESENPDEPKRYAAAHIWLSQQLIRRQRLEGFDETRNTEAMAHLQAAIAVEPSNIRAQANLVDLFLTRARSLEEGSTDYIDNLEKARESLEGMTGYRNFFRMEQILAMPQLVDVCMKLGDEDGARRALNTASSKVTRLASLNPEIYEIWLSLVQSAVAMKNYDQADEFIQTGYQTVQTEDTRRKIMQLASIVHIKNADDFKDISTEENFRSRLFALCKAIASNPRDVNIYDRLVDYIDTEETETESDVWLRNATGDCPIPGMVHILIGTRELLRGDVAGGQTSWDIAQHQFGSTEFVTHRLLSVAIKKEPKFGEGKLVDIALELFPDQFMLYETRGAIRKGRGLYPEAIEDFEVVHGKMSELITVHKYLEECYRQVGNTEKAAYHAQRLQEILSKFDDKQRERYEEVLDTL